MSWPFGKVRVAWMDWGGFVARRKKDRLVRRDRVGVETPMTVVR